MISYFGHYTFNEDENIVVHHVEGSLFPNWQGTAMKRFAKFKNDEMELSTEPTTWGGESSVGVIIWKAL